MNLSPSVLAVCLASVFFCGVQQAAAQATHLIVNVARIDSVRILRAARDAMNAEPLTVTAFSPSRSAGGLHDFFSEGDYWWPNPVSPDSPYVQRDGMSNPDNFVKHREAMIRLADVVTALTAATVLTGDRTYASRALVHLKAWFVDTLSMMSPHLLFAQAIHGRVTGRGIGIIDTIHLLEVARSIERLESLGAIDPVTLRKLKAWFSQYLRWLTTHRYGLDERAAKNNHGTWYVAQVAGFAHLTGDTAVMRECRERFKTILLPGQMGMDGSFPLELSRTKPYNYSLFNLEGMAVICQILSTPRDPLWLFQLPDGRGMRKAMDFMLPYIADKTSWPYPRDIQYFEFYPTRQPCLLFAGLAFNDERFVTVWKTLDPEPHHPEVRRNICILQPVLWIE